MLKSKTRWNLQTANQEIVELLAQELHITPLVATLLVNRGLDTVEAARSFLFIKKQEFHDPYLLKDMDVAVGCIHRAIENQEKIRIFGDYDADGVSSTTVMMETLTKLGADVDFYIPNRFSEGYGPNEMAFRLAAEQGVKLMITVDTGISAVEEADIAKELGIDYIVTDHHEPSTVLPDALAIIHPKLEDNPYPFKDLAGVGVALKLAHALLGELPEDLLEIAAIGTIADLVPLFGENRLIAARGIEKLRQTERPGLIALMKKANIQQQTLTEESIGFGLAPRINAVGRLGDADPAVDLLMETDQSMANIAADEIDEINKQRQAIVADIMDKAVNEVETNFPIERNSVLVIGGEGWNAGIVGIVASRLVDRFYRPVIVLSYDPETGLAKGSGRSIEGFDLFKNLSTCQEMLPHFGGHPMAAGMTLKIDDVPELRGRLCALASEQLTQEQWRAVTKLDSTTTLADISIQSIEEMNLLAPFGMGNPKPRILIENVHISSVRKIGANHNHLKLVLEETPNVLDGVGFGLGDAANHISPISAVSVIGELSINEWNNNRKPQIFVKDLCVDHWQLFDHRGMSQVNKWLAETPAKGRKAIVFNESTFKQYPFLENGENVLLVTSVDIAEAAQIDGGTVILMDMPPERALIERLFANKHPERIYAHFYHQQDNFLATLPTRDHFKWFYGFLTKKGSFDIKRRGDELAKYRGWSRHTIDFISQVFFELDFVTIEDGLIELSHHTNKRDLNESDSYRRKTEQFELEQELVYSSYQQLFEWFNKKVSVSADLEEETTEWI